uniref:Uncharacterized protein n=1 Tax=Candidatus Caldatribacterium californiense TaxID=1454726 RepID=A0A7V4DH97_9BACT
MVAELEQSIRQIAERLGQELRLSFVFSGKDRVFFPLESREAQYFGVLSLEEPPFEGKLVTLDFQGKRLSVFPFTLGNALSLRDVIPELTPTTLCGEVSWGVVEESPALLSLVFGALWEKGIFPLSGACAAEGKREELEKALQSSLWGAFAGGRRGKFGVFSQEKAWQFFKEASSLGYTVYILEGEGHVRKEVFTWERAQLKEAFFRLSSREKEAWKRYCDRSFRFSQDFVLSFPEEHCLRMLFAYFPLLDILEEGFAFLESQDIPFDLGVSFEKLPPEAHFFLAEELHRRGVDFHVLFPGVPEGDSDLSFHILLARTIGGYRLGFSCRDPDSLPSFPEDWRALYLFSAHLGFPALLEVIAPEDPDLFRRLLEEAFEASGVSFALEAVPNRELPGILEKPFFRNTVRNAAPLLFAHHRETLEAYLFTFESAIARRLRERLRL